jgi:flagellar biosynthesis chaperone FliJ
MRSALLYVFIIVLAAGSVSSANSDSLRYLADYGSGSWESGYKVPEILVSVSGKTLSVEGQGKFVATRLERPVFLGEKLGWAFYMTGTIGETLQKVMIKEYDQWYIPFRWISSNVKYVNPNGYKYIEFTVTNDNKENYNFRVNLPYKTFGWIISDEEGTKIANLLNTLRDQHQAIVNTAKSKATTASSLYMTNKPLLAASQSESGSLAKAIADAKARIEVVENLLLTSDSTRVTADTKLYKLNNQRLTLESVLSDKIQKGTSMNSEHSAIEENLQSLSGNANEQADARARLEGTVATARSDLEMQLDILRKAAPERKTEINNANKSIIDLDGKAFSSNLNMVYP